MYIFVETSIPIVGMRSICSLLQSRLKNDLCSYNSFPSLKVTFVTLSVINLSFSQLEIVFFLLYLFYCFIPLF